MKQTKLFITGIIFFVFGIVLTSIPMTLTKWCDPMGYILPLCFAVLGAIIMLVEAISEKVNRKKDLDSDGSQDNNKR